MKKDIQKNQNNLIENIKKIIFAARKSVAISVNNELITAYRNIGRIIIENEIAAEYILGGPEDNVFTSKFTYVLPDKDELIRELENVIKE